MSRTKGGVSHQKIMAIKTSEVYLVAAGVADSYSTSSAIGLNAYVFFPLYATAKLP